MSAPVCDRYRFPSLRNHWIQPDIAIHVFWFNPDPEDLARLSACVMTRDGHKVKSQSRPPLVIHIPSAGSLDRLGALPNDLHARRDDRGKVEQAAGTGRAIC